MTPRTRIERLENRYPASSPAEATFPPEFSSFRVAGMSRAEAQRKYVQALETAIAEPEPQVGS